MIRKRCRSRLTYETLAENWMEGYPGDDVIDIFGMDNYWDKGNQQSEDADPCCVYRYEPVDPADRSKGYKAIYQYSLKEDFNKFANHEAVYFVEKK